MWVVMCGGVIMIGSTTIKQAFVIKTSHLFLLFLFSILAQIYITQNFIMTHEVYYNLYSDRLEPHRVDEIVLMVKKFSIWSYPIAPLLLLIQLTFVALLIQLPLVFKFIDISFSRLFRIVSFAYIPLLIRQFVYIIWLLRLPANEINEKTLTFVPLAITNFVNSGDYPKHIYSFLGNFNLFEIVWVVVAIVGLYQTKKLEKIDAALIVFCVWTFIMIFIFVLITYLNKVG